MGEFELGDLRALPGEVVKGHLGHVVMPDGSRVGIPAVIVNGAHDGPTLVVTAGVHGTEVAGVGALLQVVRTLDPAALRGTLVAVTVANPLAFQFGSYATPYDGGNLQGTSFWQAPGSGRLTDRMAAIAGTAVRRATHYIDLHANSDPAIPMLMIHPRQWADEATRRESLRMAEAWGTTVVAMLQDHPETPAAEAATHGIPAIMPELMGNLYIRDDNVRAGAVGLTNVMKAIGILDGEPEPQAIPPIPGDLVYHGPLAVNASGLLWVRRPPGTFMRAGEVVAEVIDVWGDVVEPVRMPVDGYYWAIRGRTGSTHTVAEGSPIGYVFRQRTP